MTTRLELFAAALTGDIKSQRSVRAGYKKYNHWNLYWMVESHMEELAGPNYWESHLGSAREYIAECEELRATQNMSEQILAYAKILATTKTMAQMMGVEAVPASYTGV